MLRALFQGISSVFAVGLILGLVLSVYACPEEFPEVTRDSLAGELCSGAPAPVDYAECMADPDLQRALARGRGGAR